MEEIKRARYRVLETKSRAGADGMTCCPVGGPLVGGIKLADGNGEEFYLFLVEVDGILNWFKTERSTIEEQLSKQTGDTI